ncbi:DUF805 domain-containing protein [Halomonas salipaludis]|uniref:DUF805 domain-containing protein n=1 Tax=Halomonas salipaludis TaxID=2032625 RepID=A0A2A2F4F1_9GAMM|nr:DUF805 domain-containing protein [Halomonas salipaludis]PAU79475.1 hypothetical protein CK498_03685 [Halomonas salipaludis]
MSVSEPNDMTDQRIPEGVWQGFFQSRGRLGRVRYVLFSLTLLLFLVLFAALSNVLWSRYYLEYGQMITLASLVIALMALVINVFHGARRLHDFGASGWWMLLYLVAPAYPFLLLALVLVPGSSGDNRYGRASSANSKKVYAMLSIVMALLLLLLALL